MLFILLNNTLFYVLTPQSMCDFMGGKLVEVNTAEENAYLYGQAKLIGCKYTFIIPTYSSFYTVEIFRNV